MTKRIFRSVIAVAAVVLAASLVLILGVLYEYFSTELQTELKDEAHYIAAAVEQNGEEYLEGLRETDKRITLIDSDGTVLFDSVADAQTMENHLDREEIQQAAETGEGSVYRYSDTLSDKTYYYALQLENGQFLRISGTQYTVVTLLLGIFPPLAIVLIGMVILSAVFANRIAKRITEPINAIDLDDPDEDSVYEELAPLLVKIRRQKRFIKDQLLEAKRRQREFSMITENMAEGFLVINSRTGILSYNSSALRILGAEGNSEQKSILELNRSAPFRDAVEQVLEGRHQELTMEIGGSNYQLIANPVLQEEHVTGAVLVLLDVTEHTHLEQLRREFTANVSHELKTPLTSISGFAEIIRDGMVRPEDISGFAGKIFSESQRLITLVEDIIKLSQLDEGSVPYQKEPVDLYDLGRQMLDRFQKPLQRAKVSMLLEGESAIITAVRPILDEVLYNLCDNAIKYNKPGGKVVISVSQNEQEIHLSVSDTGVGIPKADQERVFERFYRVDKSHSKEIGGTGLGLSIVKHGASFLKAKLKMSSTPGKGTTISLSWDREDTQRKPELPA